MCCKQYHQENEKTIYIITDGSQENETQMIPELPWLFTFLGIFFDESEFLILMKSSVSTFLLWLVLFLCVSCLRNLCLFWCHGDFVLCFLLETVLYWVLFNFIMGLSACIHYQSQLQNSAINITIPSVSFNSHSTFSPCSPHSSLTCGNHQFFPHL